MFNFMRMQIFTFDSIFQLCEFKISLFRFHGPRQRFELELYFTHLIHIRESRWLTGDGNVQVHCQQPRISSAKYFCHRMQFFIEIELAYLIADHTLDDAIRVLQTSESETMQNRNRWVWEDRKNQPEKKWTGMRRHCILHIHCWLCASGCIGLMTCGRMRAVFGIEQKSTATKRLPNEKNWISIRQNCAHK